MHVGVNPGLEKGGPFPGSARGQWFHIRQDKHHRWSLDERQIYQYHLGGALHPHIRWWEAIDVPRRSVQVVEVGEGITIVSLVCEDLAQNDDVAEVIRAIGPTIVSTALLDGPQLTSRWSARYASVLADDPGSAVMTLTSFGMAQRSRPSGRDSSPVIALWKDPARGTREISLEPGAQGVLLTVCGARATRRSADGRWPVESGTHYFDVAVHQIRPSDARSESPNSRSASPTPRVIEVDDLTVLTGWAEAVTEALAYTPARAQAVLADARPGASWRLRPRRRGTVPAAQRRDRLARASTQRGHAGRRRAVTRRGTARRRKMVSRASPHSTHWRAACCDRRLNSCARDKPRKPVRPASGSRAHPDGSASRSAARVLIPSLGKIRYRWPLTVRCER